ncbi:diaminopimelate decarboxylase, partial [bacterium]|nr:diaminopimelate decarboxylase [bacterium]
MQTVNQNLKPLTAKRNDKNNLEIGGCDLTQLAKDYKTPLYVMCEETLRQIANEYKSAFKYEKFKPTYASKALLNVKIAEILSSEGFGFDAVSMGEIWTIYKAGCDMSRVTFNGNNKTKEEIALAVKLGVGHFSIDNFYEIKILSDELKKYDKVQKVLLRITPGIECHTHEYIQTGQIDSKFGFDLSQIDSAIEEILKYENIEIVGLHAHIGSQIFETKVYEDEARILISEIARINKKYNLNLSEINMGGGLGVTYTKEDNPPSVYEIADVIISAIKKSSEEFRIELPTLYIEPGRSIVCTAGVTLYTLGSSKQVPDGTKYVAIDGGMADNPRPAMYDAQYVAEIANSKIDENVEKVTISGKYCESGDILIKDIMLPNPSAEDI